MRKTHLILQHLDGVDGDEPVDAIAAATGDDTKLVQPLIYWLAKQKHVMSRTRGRWEITAAGSKWIRELLEEEGEAAPPKPARAPKKPPRPAAQISAPLRKANGHAVAAAAAPTGFKALPPIEHGVEIPLSVRSGAYRELAQQMQPGDSVLFENDSKAANLRVALRALGHKSVQRQSKDGCRVWRVS